MVKGFWHWNRVLSVNACLLACLPRQVVSESMPMVVSMVLCECVWVFFFFTYLNLLLEYVFVFVFIRDLHRQRWWCALYLFSHKIQFQFYFSLFFHHTQARIYLICQNYYLHFKSWHDYDDDNNNLVDVQFHCWFEFILT